MNRRWIAVLLVLAFLGCGGGGGGGGSPTAATQSLDMYFQTTLERLDDGRSFGGTLLIDGVEWHKQSCQEALCDLKFWIRNAEPGTRTLEWRVHKQALPSMYAADVTIEFWRASNYKNTQTFQDQRQLEEGESISWTFSF